jgi:signal transduction histidine kinase
MCSMSIAELYGRRAWRPPLSSRLGQLLQVEADPCDTEYRQRHTAEMIKGFGLLSLLVFSSMAVLLMVHIAQRHGLESARAGGPSPLACALLAGAGALGLLASKSVRSAAAAFVATATLLVASVLVITVDCLQQASRNGGSTGSLLQILLSVLVLSAALLPLRPSRMLALGLLLLATSSLAARLTKTQLQIDSVEVVGAAIVVAVSVVAAARSTSDRIRTHQAHASAMEAQREAEAARQRALLAESAVTMERLAASLSHEFNTPIGVLKSATETLIRALQREASFPRCGSGRRPVVEPLFDAVVASTTRLGEIVARIQRFANLDRSAVRLVDVNQLVQDAVAVMNPPSANQAQVQLRLHPLPQIWCKPHALNIAIASILNVMLDRKVPVTIETWLWEGKIAITTTRCSLETAPDPEPELRFAVLDGRIRATGWDLFAARQLVRENGGDIRVEGQESTERRVTISLPAVPAQPVQETDLGAPARDDSRMPLGA